MSAPRLTDEQKRAIVIAYRAGEKLASIASQYGIDRSYPRILARRDGAEARDPHKQLAAVRRHLIEKAGQPSGGQSDGRPHERLGVGIA